MQDPELTHHSEWKGTISPKRNFDADWAAEKFKKALSIPGTEGKVYINLLVAHTNVQREAIDTRYRSLYGSDLYDDLKEELAGNFRDAVLCMMTYEYELQADTLYKAVSGAHIDEVTLVEMLCLKSYLEIESLDKWFTRKHGKSIDPYVLNELTDDFRVLVEGFLSASRDSNATVDSLTARKHAQELYDAGIASRESNGNTFIHLISSLSYPQIKETIIEYERISQEPIENAIKQKYSSSLKRGLLAAVQRIRDPLEFWAERINSSLKGPESHDMTLIRNLITTSEINLENIKMKYKELFGISLVNDIRHNTSGDYGKLLQAIVGS